MKVGDKVRVLRNSNSHNYTIGKAYTILRLNGGSVFTAGDSGWVGNNLEYADCEAIAETRKDINAALAVITETFNRERQHYLDKLAYLDATGAQAYDSTDAAVYRAVMSLDSKAPMLEKVATIAAIIRQLQNV